MDLFLLSTVAFSSPSAPAPDPELEAQRKQREEDARKEKIDLARKEAKQATYNLQKRSKTMLAGYRGYQDDGDKLGYS